MELEYPIVSFPFTNITRFSNDFILKIIYEKRFPSPYRKEINDLKYLSLQCQNLKSRFHNDFSGNASFTFWDINAPVLRKPKKEFSDLSGLLAHYKDPITTLLYSNVCEYAKIQTLTLDFVQQYKALYIISNSI